MSPSMARGQGTYRRRSLRWTLIVTVAVGVMAPLIIVGAWTNSRLERAGEALLRGQMGAALSAAEGVIARNWYMRRGDLMLLADNQVVRDALISPDRTLSAADRQFLQDAYARLQAPVEGVVYSDANGVPRWRVGPDPGLEVSIEPLSRGAVRPVSRVGTLAVDLPVTDDVSGRVFGTMAALLPLTALLPSAPALGVPGASFNIVDPVHGVPLLLREGPRGYAPAPDAVPDSTEQVVMERKLDSPPLVLVVSAPLAPFVAPFERSARSGMLTVLAILVVAVMIAVFVTSRATRSLEALADAADAVARGELERRVEVRSSDEIGRLAVAFNRMTQDLRRTIREASQRKALAAVGEFAAELAHEVRNPLSSVRLDLQRVEERLPPDGKLREPLRRALAAIDRLNRTVTGSLRLARTGSIALTQLPLSSALEPAIAAATPEFTARGITLDRGGVDFAGIWLQGDGDALSQLFTNILINAAEAAGRSGCVTISVVERDRAVTVQVADNGPGISPDMLRQLDGPFRTTKQGGTGLGLRIARRIASAHGGMIEFESMPGAGTVVKISLPRNGQLVHG